MRCAKRGRFGYTGKTYNRRFDISGTGVTYGGGVGPVSGSYIVDNPNKPSYQIYGVGPSFGLKYPNFKVTGGETKTETFTFPTLMPSMIGVLLLHH